MIQKDFVLRQIQQLVQVLAYILQLKGEGREAEAQEQLDNALLESLGTRIKDLLELEQPELLALCSSDDRLNSNMALVLAELLEEGGHMSEKKGEPATAQKCFRKALDLYEAIVASAEAVPLDIYDRIARLKDWVIQ